MPKLIPDWNWAVLTILQEASSEPFEGKVAVAEVIRNRMARRYQSDGTILGTVLRPLQFSGWNTSDPNRIRVAQYEITDPAVVDSIKAFQRAFEEKTSLTQGAVLYHAKTMIPYPPWASSPKVHKITEIGNHIFYLEEV
jgi:spore germination cell wall hydrolase CwlJ-like protein